MIDLHCHSYRSDGVLAPGELVARAASRSVKVLALTDHDDTSGLAEAHAAAEQAGITLINGVEITVTWSGQTVHVVGLRIDPEHPNLVTGLGAIREGRRQRAEAMAAQFDRAGITGSLEGARSYAINPELVGRMHFARFLAKQGFAKNVQRAFEKYLAKGRLGYVESRWASLRDAINWINKSHGVAVLAHPGRYKFSESDTNRLLTEFKELGGKGIEVVTSNHTTMQFSEFARLARQYSLLASCGSDFHDPENSYTEFGRLPALPSGLKPIWHDWNLM